MEIHRIITELQSYGTKISKLPWSRRGGAGPAEGGYVIVDNIAIAVPVNSEFVLNSPYLIKQTERGTGLFKNGRFLCHVKVVTRPKFYDFFTTDGIPYWKIALLHGTDCLATSVIQTCMLWDTSKRCKFCGIQISLQNGTTIKVKKPHHLAEVALKAKVLDCVSHVVLTTGSHSSPYSEISVLAKSTKAIKETTGLPVHVQCLPPKDVSLLLELKNAGVDTIGLHVESFDKRVLSLIAPFKATIGYDIYEKAWKAAVKIFGVNQVSSFIIVGLGETDESIIAGCEKLSDLGVYPFLVPFRPIPDSLMANVPPPSPDRMIKLYEKVSDILKIKGITVTECKAGCVKCGACSAIKAYEKQDELICHPCRTDEELASAFRIRNEVFVNEQKIFKESDIDENDKKSIHLVAKKGREVIGTVRVYPENDNGHWVGGRLAVKKEFRTSGAGKLLVQEAVRYATRQGCTKFTAHIQKSNVDFFKHLGWRPVGPMSLYFGKPHQLMEAEL